MASAGERLTKDEWLKKKQLEEARKAGTAPAELDEEGKAINPHIPQYIAQAPWYYGTSGPSLRHQRTTATTAATGAPSAQSGAASSSSSGLDGLSSSLLYEEERRRKARGHVAGAAPTRWRKGACTNCGATTHDAKSCCERPRAVGAKWTGRDLRPDEVIMPTEPQSAGFDAKRDRWAGYDPSAHSAMLASFYESVERERRSKMRQHEEEEASEATTDGLREGTGYNNAPIQRMDAKTRTTVRDLRIREDTAKYLRNLDVNSAYYDPKTRSMRENPTPGVDPAQASFAGDNFVRVTGDAVRFAELQLHAFEAAEQGTGEELNVLAAPSQAELLHREFKARKEALREETRKALAEKYGGQEHVLPDDGDGDDAAKTVRFASTEEYVEYSRDGRVIKGAAATA
jgi:pre-mRNA-processing factor SLU7